LSKIGLRLESTIEKARCTAPAWCYDELEAAFIRFVREVKFADVFLASDSGSAITNLEALKATAITKITELKGLKDEEIFCQFYQKFQPFVTSPKLKA
jgi:hypothetical protein